MKRILILIVALFAIVVIGDLVNGIGANDKPTLEGYLLNREGSLYLIADEDFDVKVAKELSNEEFIRIYGEIYILDKTPFSFSQYKDGEIFKVWYSGVVLESHPAQINVLKLERK